MIVQGTRGRRYVFLVKMGLSDILVIRITIRVCGPSRA